MVSYLDIFAGAPVKVEVDHGLDVAGGNFHDYRNACIGIVLAKLFLQGTFGKVLETDVDGGDYVTAVDGGRINN